MDSQTLGLLQAIAYGLVLIGLTWSQWRQLKSQQKHNAATTAAVAAVPAAVSNQIVGPLSDKIATPLSSLNAVISVLTNTLVAQQSATQPLLDQIPSLLADNHNWKIAFDDSLRERDKGAADRANLVNMLTSQATQIAGLVADQTANKVNFQKIEETIEGLHTDLAIANKRIAALELENGTLREANEKSVVAYQERDGQVKSLQSARDDDKAIITDLQKQLDALTVEFKSYRDERHAERNEWAAKLQSFEFALQGAIAALKNGDLETYVQMLKAKAIDVYALAGIDAPLPPITLVPMQEGTASEGSGD